MADTPIARETTEPIEQPTQETPIVEPEKNTGDLKVAVHQARQELKTERDRAAEAERKAADLESQLKEARLSSLPDDEQIEEGFVQMTQEKILSQVDQEKFKQLPSAIRSRLESNPWAFVAEDAIKRETKFAESKREYYRIVGDLATKSINDLLEETNPAVNPSQQEEPKDPSITDNKPAEAAIGYTESELRVLAWKDPQKFEEVRKALSQR